MRKLPTITILFSFVMVFAGIALAQTNEWGTQYTTFDDAVNGTGTRTSSVAAVGQNDFVALISDPTATSDIFVMDNNYLVGYVDADSAVGRVAPQPYNPSQQFDTWASGLDQVPMSGAWQLASGQDNYVYVANNDENHNILVFQLTDAAVDPTDFRMETGTANIYAIDVDTAGYVYVADYTGDDTKTNEVKVYQPIGAEGTTWGDPNGHTDLPITTIDLPPGIYQGITVSQDGSQIWVSSRRDRMVWKYTGDPVNGYSQDTGFSYTMAEDDTVGNGGFGTPEPLGLSYSDEYDLVFAAIDTFLSLGGTGGYPYGRVYVLDGTTGANLDTIDIAEWNLAITGDYSTGSGNGRAGGFTSVMDVDFEPTDNAVYTQTYYGWAVEKWIFDGDLDVTSVEQISETIPQHFELRQNYPNPFNPATTIEFDMLQAGHVTLRVHNIIGQEIGVLVDETRNAGTHRVTFEAGNLTSGVYFYSLETGSFKTVKKMVLTK